MGWYPKENGHPMPMRTKIGTGVVQFFVQVVSGWRSKKMGAGRFLQIFCAYFMIFQTYLLYLYIQSRFKSYHSSIFNPFPGVKAHLHFLPANSGLSKPLPVCFSCAPVKGSDGRSYARTGKKQSASRSAGWWVGSHPRLSAGVYRPHRGLKKCPLPGIRSRPPKLLHSRFYLSSNNHRIPPQQVLGQAAVHRGNGQQVPDLHTGQCLRRGPDLAVFL